MATDDFFRARLDQMIDLRHPLAVLASRMPWPPKFDTTTSFLATSVHQSDGGSTTCIIARVVFTEPV